MKIHDMKRSDKEKQAERARWDLPIAPGGDDFPHALHMRLGEPELQKLGIAGMPKVGDVYRVEGEMKVTAAEGRDSEQAPATRNVEFVLHRLGAEPKATPNGANNGEPPRTVREELEDARHQARGSTIRSGSGAPIGARLNNGRG